METFEKELRYCAWCPKLCHFACPVSQAEARETVTAREKMTLAWLLQERRLPLHPDHAEILYRCAGCLRCRTYCEHLHEVPEALREFRELLTRAGWEPETLKKLKRDFQEYGNPYGTELRDKIIGQLPSSYLQSGAQAVYFPGCRQLKNFAPQLKKLQRILEILGVDYLAVYNGRRLCCGLPLYHAGYRDQFRAHALEIAESLSAYKLVVSGCPACVYTFKALYPLLKIPVRFETRHFSEFILGRLEKRPPRNILRENAVYHDPCYLGRYLGIYDAPRRILSACLKNPLRAFMREREEAVCCGAGGLLSLNFPATAARIAAARIAEAEAAGAHFLVSACPGCQEHLQSQTGKRVWDLMEIVNDCL